jgi:hypothetical protein
LDNYKQDNITLRLIIIDSMYSTQMNRRYYGIQDLADKLCELHKGTSLSKRFMQIAADPDTLLNVENQDLFNLFNGEYGIGKIDVKDTKKAISLISKYAYYETKGNFPIYDSIVKEMYQIIWKYCHLEGKPAMKKISNDIIDYLKAINILREKLGIKNSSTYDDLDIVLWHLGKILRGNLSLVLSKDDYVEFVDIYKNKNYNEVIKNFDIKKVDISKLTFLDNKPTLKKFFEIALDISNKVN